MVLLQTLQPKKTLKNVIHERSLLSSRYVFWPVLLKNGTVTKMEDDTYSKFYDKYAWFPGLYIFLSKSPEKCYEHIQTRGQAGDTQVTLKYLHDLHEEYLKLLRNVPCKVVVVNAERPVGEIHKEICQILSENELFIGNSHREEVHEKGSPRREVHCTPFPHMCRVS